MTALSKSRITGDSGAVSFASNSKRVITAPGAFNCLPSYRQVAR